MRWLPFAIALALTSVSSRAQEAMPVETVARVKEATTYIRADRDANEGGPSQSGSGFVVAAEGMTGYIVTNAHVIAGTSRDVPAGGRLTAEVVFRSGTKSESRVVAEAMTTDPGRDLALLKVTNVPHLPAPIELNAAVPFETMTVYIFGFPFGEQLALGEGNPPVNVGRGQISSLRRNESDQLTSVLLDGALNPGNSGGPVVDARGRLIGISKATIRGANIGFAIAVPELLAILGGRTEEPMVAVTSVDEEAVVLEVEVPLIDPLGRLKSARLLRARGTSTTFAREDRPAPADGRHDDGPRARSDEARMQGPHDRYGPLQDADVVPLGIGQGRATGSFKVAVKDRDVMLSSQVAYVDDSGQVVYTRPGLCLLGVAGPKHRDRGSKGVTFWGQAIDPDGDCQLKLENGALVCGVPGTLHDLNIDIGKNNAARVVQTVEGDFVATVKIGGSFQPGEVRTGPRSVPYNGGGLLAWADAGNYIRLERGSMHRSGRVLGLVLFESREHGTRASVNNKGGLDPREDRWLRLERHGKSFAGSISLDGRDWEALEPIEAEWPSRLRIGVDAVSSSGDSMTVRFSDYTLEKTKGRVAADHR